MAEPRLRVDPLERLRPVPNGTPRRRGAGGGILRGLARVAVLLLLWAAIIGGGVLGYFALTLPDTSDLTRAERHDPRRGQQPADDVRRSLRSAADLAGNVTLSAEGGDRDRGSPVLQPFRRRSDRALARRRGQPHGRSRRTGRQHDHPAARQEPVSDVGAELCPQGAGDSAGTLARAPLYQERDPRDLSQSRLSRRRHLWRRC